MRQFHDESGTRWETYEVSRDSLTIGRPDFLPPEFRNGWLVFENGVERRRLAPFPPEWMSYSLDALRALLKTSEVVDRPRRRVEPRREDPDTTGLEVT